MSVSDETSDCSPLGYADLHVGRSFRSHGRTVTETDHVHFMMLTGDWHPIHADEIYARAQGTGRIVHGAFGIALATSLANVATPFADRVLGALGIKEWRFVAPMTIGLTVHADVLIESRRITSDGARYVVERRIRLRDDQDRIFQDGLFTSLLKLTPETQHEVQ